jgi:hypothetical protein
MRHSFSFPVIVRDAVRAFVREAIDPLSASAFEQEPSYVGALMGRLIGTAYEGPEGSVRFRTTIINPIGSPSAESLSGADLAITADISRYLSGVTIPYNFTVCFRQLPSGGC